MRSHRPQLRLVLVTVVAGASATTLLAARPALGAGSLSRGDDVAVATAWVVALVASIWLFSVCGTCLLAIGARRPTVARAFSFALPQALRRSVEIALVASSLVVSAAPAHAVTGGTGGILDQPVVRAPRSLAVAPSTAAAPARRAMHRAPGTTVADHKSPRSTTNAALSAPATSSSTQPVPRRATLDPRLPAIDAPVPLAPSTAPPRDSARVVVRPGDNLWVIARAELIRSTGARPDNRRVARYWRSVIEANRDTLRSGDPRLIFPGEIVTLPPVPHVS
jgi:hypothetical protein